MDKKDIRKDMKSFLNKLENTPKEPEVKKESKEHIINEKHANYFEGELQLRNISEELLEEILTKIHQYNANIVEVKEFEKTDCNLKVSSKKTIRNIGRWLRKNHGGELKESEQLFSKSRQTGKNIYRLNIFFRKFDLSVGDFVLYHNEPYKIKGFVKDDAKITHCLTLKKTQGNVKDLKIIEKHKTAVMQIEPEIKVLDKNYQPIPLLTKRSVKLNQKIDCVLYEDKAIDIKEI